MLRGFKKFILREAPADPTTKKCPECVSEIAIAARRCPQCTAVLA